MSDNLRFSFENTSPQKIFEWLKKEIQNGYFKNLSNLSDEQLLNFSIFCNPLASIQLSTAGRLGILQLEERKRKSILKKRKGGTK